MSDKRTIWKYTLEIADSPQLVRMPIESIVRHVDLQHNKITMWVEVNLWLGINEDRYFIVHGTGQTINHDGVYIGTVQQLLDGFQVFVWHIFEEQKNE